MARKFFNGKLRASVDLPKVVSIAVTKLAESLKSITLLVAAPLEYYALMKRVPAGKLKTIGCMMTQLAKQHHASATRP